MAPGIRQVQSTQTRSGVSLLDVVDVHVGGDVHRIVMNGVKPLPGASVLEQMKFLKEHGDGLRKLLLEEPRGGHPSLFADLVVPSSNPQADAGYIIMETMGYPLISGTNTMSTAIALLEAGRIPMRDGVVPVTLEAPGGLVEVKAKCQGGKVRSITYEAKTPSFVADMDVKVEVPGWGSVAFDVVWTGAFYPIVDASVLGFALVRSDEAELVRFAKAFLGAARKVYHPLHPAYGDEGPLSFVVFAGPLNGSRESGWQRNVCCYVYPENSVCRCPAGVPTTAATVQLLRKGDLSIGDTLRSVSIFGTDLHAKITGTEDYHGHMAARAAVTGTGWIIARSQLSIDFEDPLTPKAGLEALLKN